MCCHYPKPQLSNETMNACNERCKDTKDECCQGDCVNDVMNLWIDGKINPIGIVKLFKPEMDGEELSKIPWREVLGKSGEECQAIGWFEK